MSRLLSWWRRIDWDDVFSYNTVKNVKIRDRRLGLLHLVFLLAALGFIIGEVFYNEQAYNEFDVIQGSVQFEISNPPGGVQTSQLTYCSSSCRNFSAGEPGCNCVYWDAADLLYPEAEESAAFVATRATVTNAQQPQAPCVGGVCTTPWTNGTIVGPFYTVGPDQFILSIDHEMIAPQFYQQDIQSHGGAADTQSKWLRRSFDVWGQMVDSRGDVVFESPENGDDVFPLSELLQAADVTLEQLRDDGGIIRVSIVYGDCHRLIVVPFGQSLPARCIDLPLGQINYYQYQVSYLPSTVFSVTRTIYSTAPDGTTVRDLKDLVGLRFIFRVGGQAGSFSFAAFLQSLMTIFLLFSLATFIVDMLVMFVVPGRQLYRKAKFEVTENFSQLRQRLTQEQDMKDRIVTITKMARFQSSSQVERLLEELKNLVPANDYETLVLKCIEVYGQEVLDLKSAQAMFSRIESDQGRLKAHLLLGQLKEAYILAAKMDSIADINAIRAEASNTNNLRVQQLCDQFLAQRSPGSVVGAGASSGGTSARSGPLGSAPVSAASSRSANPLYAEVELRAL